MNGLEKFQIRRSEKFKRTLQKQLRDRYRKNSVGAAECVELIEEFINLLSVDPRPRPALGHLEPWPKGSSRAGWELWKLEFKMPQILRGEAGQGRLIYLIDTTRKEVSLVWIYTHAEFKNRPPDEALKPILLAIMESSEISEVSNDSSATDEELEEEESSADRTWES